MESEKVENRVLVRKIYRGREEGGWENGGAAICWAREIRLSAECGECGDGLARGGMRSVRYCPDVILVCMSTVQNDFELK